MTRAEAWKAFKKMLPVEEVVPMTDIKKRRRYEKVLGIECMRNDALLTDMYIIVSNGENSICKYSIEKLRLAE